MNWFGYVSVLPANMKNHVRTVDVYEILTFREE